MDKVICPKCKEVVAENVDCEASGIITCEECEYQLTWKCDGKNIVSK